MALRRHNQDIKDFFSAEFCAEFTDSKSDVYWHTHTHSITQRRKTKGRWDGKTILNIIKKPCETPFKLSTTTRVIEVGRTELMHGYVHIHTPKKKKHNQPFVYTSTGKFPAITPMNRMQHVIQLKQLEHFDQFCKDNWQISTNEIILPPNQMSCWKMTSRTYKTHENPFQLSTFYTCFVFKVFDTIPVHSLNKTISMFVLVRLSRGNPSAYFAFFSCQPGPLLLPPNPKLSAKNPVSQDENLQGAQRTSTSKLLHIALVDSGWLCSTTPLFSNQKWRGSYMILYYMDVMLMLEG